MVSIKDVAKQAGVAISTVSKVLNNYPNVSEETKKKVNDAIAQLGFVPNAIAASLSSKQSGRIALLLDVGSRAQTVDEIPLQYIMGAISRAKEMNMDVITVFFTMLKGMTLDEMIRYFQSQAIEGIIIFGLSKKDTNLLKLVQSDKFKVVVVDAPIYGDHISSIHIDHTLAQYEVAKEMLNFHSCKKVLYIAGKTNGYVSEERLNGMKKLADELNIKLFQRTGNFSELEARNITMKYAKSKDAIVCASDLMAIGAMKALIDMDIFRPVCGFDGINLMGYAGKQMHTVKQDFVKIAGAAVEEMNNLINGESGREIIMPHELIRMEYMDVIR